MEELLMGGGAEAECPVSTRSLGLTLLAAASTLGLLIMANWDLAWAIALNICGGREPLLRQRRRRCCSSGLKFLSHVIVAVLILPFLPLVVSMWNVWCVWRTRRELHKQKAELLRRLDIDDRAGTVPIVSLCPILVQLPQGTDPTRLPFNNNAHAVEVCGHNCGHHPRLMRIVPNEH